jgi:hypothetical protein
MGYRQDVPPVSLVSQFDDYDATDPRDKVYALLNLVDIDMLGLEPDYTKPVEKIYQDAAVLRYLEYCETLDGNLQFRSRSPIMGSGFLAKAGYIYYCATTHSRHDGQAVASSTTGRFHSQTLRG